MPRKNGFSIKGLKNLQKRTTQMQKDIQKLEQQKTISFDELFVPHFMRKHTKFNTFDELLNAGGFEVNSQEDFAAIPDDAFDEHIANHTRFRKWQAMLDTATSELIVRTLKM
ncbi:hypothetical protein MHI27_11895 [Paenibacillus sp. FSL H8-0261]|uniref:hypothetical protein n=1 Tax=Paenibacillus sp. FSL H8-0261 TaxID=2921381 RepID=UPI00324DAD27